MTVTDAHIQAYGRRIRRVSGISESDFVALARRIQGTHGPLVLAGFNDAAKHLVNCFLEEKRVAAVIEMDGVKHGWSFRGVPIVSLDEGVALEPAAFLIMSEPENFVWSLRVTEHAGYRNQPIFLRPQPDPSRAYVLDPFRHVPFYREVMALPDRPGSMLPREKLLFLIECFRQALPVAGDVMELGVFQGGSAWFLGRFLERMAPNRELLLFDLFEEMTHTDADGVMCLDEIRHTMSFYPRVSLHDGDFSNHLDLLRPQRFCFIHYDLGFSAEWLEACYAALAPGGIMVLDNFGLMGPQCPMKFSDWLNRRGVVVSYAPSREQGWFIKRAKDS